MSRNRRAPDAAPPPRLDLPNGLRLVGTLRGHRDSIGRIAWSLDGRLLASPSKDGTVHIWDGVSGRYLHAITGHTHGALVAAFDRHGRLLATGGNDDRVRLWTVDGWRLMQEYEVESCQALAFSPSHDLLAASGNGRGALFDISTATRHCWLHDTERYSYVTDVVFDPTGSTVATTAFDGSVNVWNAADGQLRTILTGHTQAVTTAVFTPDGRLLASGGGDTTIRLWDPLAGRLLRTIEGHTAIVGCLSFLAGGRLLASNSYDGTVRLWDGETWDRVAVIQELRTGEWAPGVAFHPSLPLLATVGSGPSSWANDLIHLWELDPDRLLHRARRRSVTYTSAKIVLVGESGVGKTGLGYRLAHGAFKDHPSTHGQQFWLLDELGATRTDGAECEAVLWDLAGQPDYRLVHALFLDDADLALVLFDPTRDDDPLRGIDYWLRQLDATGTPSPAAGTGREVILVAARADRGAARLTNDEIAQFCAERGIHSYVVTSALDGAGLPELLERMRAAVGWEERPTTVTTATFKWIKDTVLALKEAERRERLILSPDELRERLERDDPTRRFTDAGLISAVGHLVNHGYVAWLMTSHGERRILLAPELLNNVAASIVLEARRNPKGLGSLEEQRLLTGDYPLPDLDPLPAEEHDAVLDSAVAMFLRHNVCFRETDPLSSRVYLVFPELINLRRPAVKSPHPLVEGMAYTATGAVQNVYASLVVLLGYTDVFTRTNQWREEAQYVVGDDLVCGFRLEAEREGELDFVLYFGTTVGEPVRMLFQSLFESFLARRDLTVRRFAPVTCGKGHQLNRAVVREQLADGNPEVFCTRCGERLPLPSADAPIQLTRAESVELDTQRRAAGQRSRFEQALFRLKTYVTEADARQPTCFVSYAWGSPEHERWVERELATDLAKAGITVILDRWENARIGASVPRFVERADGADRIIVVGTPLYRVKYENNQPMGGFVLAAEGDLVGKRMVGSESRKETVLPILLDGTKETALPPLLHTRVYGDFRKPERYFLTAFDLILSVHGIPPRDLVCAELRELIGGRPD